MGIRYSGESPQKNLRNREPRFLFILVFLNKNNKLSNTTTW